MAPSMILPESTTHSYQPKPGKKSKEASELRKVSAHQQAGPPSYTCDFFYDSIIHGSMIVTKYYILFPDPQTSDGKAKEG